MQIGSNARSCFLVSRSLGLRSSTTLAGTLLLASSAAFAQTNTTSLNGTVTDPVGLKLPGSSITLQNAATGAVTTLRSKSAGEYEFPQVVPGHYKLTVEHEGFTQQQIELDLLVSTPQTLNL